MSVYLPARNGMCEVIPMPRTAADIARNRLRAALDEYEATRPAFLGDPQAWANWREATAIRLGLDDPDQAFTRWQATMLGQITEAAGNLLQASSPGEA